jgi:histone H3/H4
LRKIRQMQKSTNLIISRLSFDRIARNILYDIDAIYRIKKSVMQALQKAAKAMFTTELKNKFNQSRLILKLTNKVSNLCVIHAKRVILQIKNMQLIKNLRRIMIEDSNLH